jgi:hypothetical protein
MAMRVAARAVEQRLNADTSDHVGSTTPCVCGCPARYAGRRRKGFVSVLGELCSAPTTIARPVVGDSARGIVASGSKAPPCRLPLPEWWGRSQPW